MKNRYILVSAFRVLIILIVIFLIILTVFKVGHKGSKTTADDKINSVGEILFYTHNIDYTDVYKNSIVDSITTEIEYSVIYNDIVLYGKAFIGNDEKLYITDDIVEKKYLILDDYVKTIYTNKDMSSGVCSFYAITKSGALYHIGLSEASISSIYVDKIETPSSITNFTNLNLSTYVDGTKDGCVVLAENGKMYHSSTMIEYSDDILNVLDKYIVYGNGVVTSFYGNALVDSNGDNYIAKTIIVANEPIKDLKYTPNIIIVTEDDKLVYLIGDDRIYEYPAKVDAIVPNSSNITIMFENSNTIKFSGFYNSDYYPILYQEE